MSTKRKPAAPPKRGLINPTTGDPWRLTDPEIKAEMKAELQAMQNDPAKAKRALQDIGILTATGRLARAYGG